VAEAEARRAARQAELQRVAEAAAEAEAAEARRIWIAEEEARRAARHAEAERLAQISARARELDAAARRADADKAAFLAALAREREVAAAARAGDAARAADASLRRSRSPSPERPPNPSLFSPLSVGRVSPTQPDPDQAQLRRSLDIDGRPAFAARPTRAFKLKSLREQEAAARERAQRAAKGGDASARGFGGASRRWNDDDKPQSERRVLFDLDSLVTRGQDSLATLADLALKPGLTFICPRTSLAEALHSARKQRGIDVPRQRKTLL
jgi:hypothetical protein